MAGIEKICEYSGSYPGPDMYGYKRNHIQILPEHRKLFLGAHAELVFTVVELQQCQRFGRTIHICTERHHEAAHYYDGDVQAWWADKLADGFFNRVEYTYELRVTDPRLQGRVDGVYLNWSRDKSSVIRRLKRMVGKNLIIRDECNITPKQMVRAWKRALSEQARQEIANKA